MMTNRSDLINVVQGLKSELDRVYDCLHQLNVANSKEKQALRAAMSSMNMLQVEMQISQTQCDYDRVKEAK